MRVLVQQWQIYGKGVVVSLSRDHAQLETTKAAMAGRKEGEPYEKTFEAEIPDDHAFAEMLEGATVFLEPDEMGVLAHLVE
ncbi:TPA: hypothetical protein DIV48_03580 [Candidatus Kaiserbacteria bacterium]|nr:MAG: hypothetical protein UY93_C0002G0326 [Parcubacteria group bacterium GW2011_GWA1_56_13]KKW46242.1 MAG: hypothetical protein UY97_C0008G0029 [Parcubacteria group bacterium GW2011_GWB1_57_6]HCR52693.1 hypothetical protein [Candidatus Kaiserbacteria bacterium]